MTEGVFALVKRSVQWLLGASIEKESHSKRSLSCEKRRVGRHGGMRCPGEVVAAPWRWVSSADARCPSTCALCNAVCHLLLPSRARAASHVPLLACC